MGRSDPLIFREYLEVLSKIQKRIDSVAFLGFSGENIFTQCINVSNRDFYDLSLGNWQINSDWQLDKKYDLIISTRCPYFAKNPQEFVEKCKSSLKPGGYALIDWGLGDHWRFDKFKVGWHRDDELEFAYEPDNYLHSCFWNENVASHPEALAFWNAVLHNNYGYSSSETLDHVVKREVPSLVSYETKDLRLKFMWPESPQLYIITLIQIL